MSSVIRSRRGGDLPGPLRRLRRRSSHRGTAGGPGRRPVPPVAEPRQGRRAVRRRAPRLPGRARSRARRPVGRARAGRGPGGRSPAGPGREVRRPRPAAPHAGPRAASPRARTPGDRPPPGLGPAHRPALRPRRHLAGTRRRALAGTPRQQAGPVQAVPGPAHRRRLRQRRPAVPGDPRTRLHRQLPRRPRLPRAAPPRQGTAAPGPADRPGRHRLDRPPPRLPHRRGPAKAQGRTRTLP